MQPISYFRKSQYFGFLFGNISHPLMGVSQIDVTLAILKRFMMEYALEFSTIILGYLVPENPVIEL